jgi:hypothetical protein
MTKVSVSLADVGAAIHRTENLYKEKLADAHQRLNQSNSILDYIEERYPAIFTEAYEVIVNHKPPPPDLSKVRLKTPEELEQEGL